MPKAQLQDWMLIKARIMGKTIILFIFTRSAFLNCYLNTGNSRFLQIKRYSR